MKYKTITVKIFIAFLFSFIFLLIPFSYEYCSTVSPDCICPPTDNPHFDWGWCCFNLECSIISEPLINYKPYLAVIISSSIFIITYLLLSIFKKIKDKFTK